MERRIIMCRRHPVLAFDYDPSSGKAVGSGRILDCSRLPLELISHGKPAIYAKSIIAAKASVALLGGLEGGTQAVKPVQVAAKETRGFTDAEIVRAAARAFPAR